MEVPMPPQTTIQVSIPSPLLDDVERLAKDTQNSVDEIVTASLEMATLAARGLPAELSKELFGMMFYTNDALRAATKPSISLEEDRRLRELTSLSKARPLSAEESQEQARLLELSRKSVLRRAQALAILKWRGFTLLAEENFEDRAELA
jgi:hypothetical protein